MTLNCDIIRKEAVSAGIRTENLVFRHWYECTSLRAGTGIFPVIAVSEDDFPALLCLSEKLQLPLFPVGGGTNLVGCDNDFSAIGVRSAEKEITVQADTVITGTGAMLGTLAVRLPEFSRGGLAPLSGIPGTIGGALRMNAGANGICISEFLKNVKGVELRTGEPFTVSGKDTGWKYRSSPVPEKGLLFSAVFAFPEAEPESERDAVIAERVRRARVTPPGCSAGSVFKNPAPDQPAGRLIEACGCKGMGAGVFFVSEKHANWIVNLKAEPGLASDCIFLMESVQEKVFSQYGIRLQPEWRFAPGNMVRT